MFRIEKYTALLLVMLAMLWSCEKNERLLPPAGGRYIHYSATVEGGLWTRATLNGSNQYVFEEGDRLYVENTGANAGSLYGILTLTSGAGARTATFEGDLICLDEFIPNSSTPLTATLIGRYERDVHSFTNGKLNSERTYRNEYASDLADAVSKYSDFVSTGNPTFGGHSFTLAQQSTFLVFSVKFSSTEVSDGSNVLVKVFNGGESPVRSANVQAAAYGNSGNRTRVRFVAAFPGETTSLSGAELSVKWGDGQEDHREFEIIDKALASNYYYTVTRTTLEEYEGFRIKATVDGTSVNLPTKFQKGNDGIHYIQYSIDEGDNWIDYTGQTISLDEGDEVWLRGTMDNCNCSGNTQLFNVNPSNPSNYLCYIAGDITSLLDDPTTLPVNAFRSAFSYGSIVDGDNGLDKEKNLPVASGTVDWVDIDSEDPLILPASTSTNCYVEMFLNCTSLTWAPELPAIDLADKCYFRMFFGCTGLESIPALPSEVNWNGTSDRQRYCFQMFQSCTGITRLTGSLFGETLTLAPNCFEDMFAHCTSLDSVSTGFLPATTLAASCYRGMFQDTRFQRAPDLLAATLVSDCYRFMFDACSNLKYIKCLATSYIKNNNVQNGVGGNGYTTNWVADGVPNNSTSTFVKASTVPSTGTGSWPRNAHGILSSWTVQNAQ